MTADSPAMHIHDLTYVPRAGQIALAVLCALTLICLIGAVVLSIRATQKKDRLGSACFALMFAASIACGVWAGAHAGHLNKIDADHIERLSQASGVPVSALGKHLPAEGEVFKVRIDGKDRTCMVEDNYSKLACYSLDTETITK